MNKSYMITKYKIFSYNIVNMKFKNNENIIEIKIEI